MLSSFQISQIISQQNQQFMQAAQYSQMIALQTPYPLGGGLGAYGGAQPTPTYPQIPHSANQQGGFRYGQPYMSGYGPGNDAASRVMSVGAGVGGAAMGIGATAMGMVPGLGFAAIPAMAGAAMGKHVLSSMVTGAQEQSGVERTLGQMQFTNPASRTGRGFTRQDSMMIGDTLRQMQAIPEMMTSMGELTRTMDKVIQTGMMQGVRDVGEFQRKFKQTVGQLKDVARVMGTTMEEAMPLLQEARQGGFYTHGAVRQNMVNRQVVGAVTGMNQQQIGQNQAYGSQLNFQMGGSRQGGSQAALRAAAQIGIANQMGALTNQEIMEATGKEGAAGIQELAANFTNMAYRASRSSVGTLMTVALAEQKGGRFTGKMDDELVRRMRSGSMQWGELMAMGRQKISGRAAKVSYVAQKDRLHAEMAASTGIEGLAMQVQNIIGNRGYNDEDVQNIVMQRFGVSEREAEQVSKVVKNLPFITAERGLQTASEGRRIAQQTRLGETLSVDALKRRIGKNIENVVTEPFKHMGVAMRDSIQKSVERFYDDLTGQYKIEMTKIASDVATGAMRTGAAGQTDRNVLALRGTTGAQLGPRNMGYQGSGTRTAALGASVGSAVSSGGLSLIAEGISGAVTGGESASLGGLRDVGVRAAHWAAGKEFAGAREERYLEDLEKTFQRKFTTDQTGGPNSVIVNTSLTGSVTAMLDEHQDAATKARKEIEIGQTGIEIGKALFKRDPGKASMALASMSRWAQSKEFREVPEAERLEWLQKKSGAGDYLRTEVQGLIRAGEAAGVTGMEGMGKELGFGGTDYKGGVGSKEEIARGIATAEGKLRESSLFTGVAKDKSYRLKGAALGPLGQMVGATMDLVGAGGREGAISDFGSFRQATKSEDYMKTMLFGREGKGGVIGQGWKGRTFSELQELAGQDSEEGRRAKGTVDLMNTLARAEAAQKAGGWSKEESKLLAAQGIKDPMKLIENAEKAREVAGHARTLRTAGKDDIKNIVDIVGGEVDQAKGLTEEARKARATRLTVALESDKAKAIRARSGSKNKRERESAAIMDVVARFTDTSDPAALGEAARRLVELGGKEQAEIEKAVGSSGEESVGIAAGMYAGLTRKPRMAQARRALRKGGKEGATLEEMGYSAEDAQRLGIDPGEKIKNEKELRDKLATGAGQYVGSRGLRESPGTSSKFADETKATKELISALQKVSANIEGQTSVNREMIGKLV